MIHQLQPETPVAGEAATGTGQCYNRCPASCKRRQASNLVGHHAGEGELQPCCDEWRRAAVTDVEDVGAGDHASGEQHQRGTVLQSTPRNYHGCNTEAREKTTTVNDLFVESDGGEHRRRASAARQMGEVRERGSSAAEDERGAGLFSPFFSFSPLFFIQRKADQGIVRSVKAISCGPRWTGRNVSAGAPAQSTAHLHTGV